MDPANLKARLAPRPAWRAADLGTRFYRHWWRQASLVWLLFTALPYALLAGYACSTRTVWPLLVFWWLKPLWERPLLAFFSHALFGDYPGPLTLLRRFPEYGRNGLAGQLLWRRLSPSRAYIAGVWQLEGSHGERAWQRAQALKRAPGQKAISLTSVVVLLEQCLTLALIALFVTLAPWRFSPDFSAWLTSQGGLHWIQGAVAWYLIMLITEPLYVAASFSLYLNERTRMEAWDLQVGLARIGERRRALGLLPSALLLMLAAGTLMTPASPALAASEAPTPQEQAQRILASPALMPMELRSERQLRPSLRDDENSWARLLAELLTPSERSGSTGPSLQLPDWLDVLVLALVVALSGLLLYLIRRGQWSFGNRRRQHPSSMPVSVAGLDVRASALPDDLAGAVNQALQNGNVREALALLLRHALATLFQRHPLALTAGATEQDCLRAYRKALGEAAPVHYLEALISAWTVTAWAHRPVDESRVRTLLDRRNDLDIPTAGERAT